MYIGNVSETTCKFQQAELCDAIYLCQKITVTIEDNFVYILGMHVATLIYDIIIIHVL